MGSLNIQNIKKDGELRLQVAEMADRLQKLVDDVYPGMKVIIANSEPEIQYDPNVSFGAMGGIHQIVSVFRRTKRPMKKAELLEELHDCGSSISMETLSAYLSRSNEFERMSRGVWALRELVSNGMRIFKDQEVEES